MKVKQVVYTYKYDYWGYNPPFDMIFRNFIRIMARITDTDYTYKDSQEITEPDEP